MLCHCLKNYIQHCLSIYFSIKKWREGGWLYCTCTFTVNFILYGILASHPLPASRNETKQVWEKSRWEKLFRRKFIIIILRSKLWNNFQFSVENNILLSSCYLLAEVINRLCLLLCFVSIIDILSVIANKLTILCLRSRIAAQLFRKLFSFFLISIYFSLINISEKEKDFHYETDNLFYF